MRSQFFMLRLTLRLTAGFMIVGAGLILLALLAGSLIEPNFISLTHSDSSIPYARYDRLHLIDIRTGVSGKISDQLVSLKTLWSPDGTRIAFGNLDVQILTWDQQDEQTHVLRTFELTPNVVDWSPDSQSLLLIMYRESGGYDLYRMKADGTELMRITSMSYQLPRNRIFDADWSPDGRFIVFAAGIGEDESTAIWEVYRVAPDGSDFQQLTHDGNRNIDPQISPDGKQITFVSWQNNNMEVFVMNADGSDPRQLTQTEFNNEIAPIWSPDSTQILFQTFINNDLPRVLDLINVDGSGRRRLVDYSSFNRPPSWSPDGKSILYEVQVGAGSELYTLDVASGYIDFLTTDPFSPDLHSTWQP
jgi:Tol biopolymer transport system component